jgi:putrescine transport system substrate-binding protein
MRFSRFHAASVLPLLLLAFVAADGVDAGPAEEKRLFIYNWTDFIGRNTIAEFEKQTGIKVTYDVYDAEETMEARLLAGSPGYDIVVASTEFFGREIKAGVYIPLDKSKLSNWKNLDPRILAIQASYDPGNAHAVPYMHAITGFAYNVDMIKARMPNAPTDSLDMIFKRCFLSRLGGGHVDVGPAVFGAGSQHHEARGLQGRGGTASEGAALHSFVRFIGVSERIGEPGSVYRDVLVQRLRALQGARPGRGRQCQPRLHGAEGGGQPELLLAADTRGRAASRSGLSIHQFQSAASGDRRHYQRDLLRQ